MLGAEASHQDARKNFNEAQRELLEAHFRVFVFLFPSVYLT